MRQECISHKYSFGRNYPVGRLINQLGLKMQVCTQRYDRRPYGVGLLVAGCDVSFALIFTMKTVFNLSFHRIKDRTSTKLAPAPTTMTAELWPSVHVLKVLARTWRST